MIAITDKHTDTFQNDEDSREIKWEYTEQKQQQEI